MFGFGRSKSSSAPMFIVGSSTLFSKTRLTPNEFGREITRLGFAFGVEQFEQYRQAGDASQEDLRLLKGVEQNPGFMQLLYANLITGALLCYAKVALQTSVEIVDEVEAGILSELRSTMPAMSEKLLNDHKHITANFAIAIEREVREVEEDASLALFLGYINDFYPGITSGKQAVPSGLVSRLTGLGSRFMAICQNKFNLSFQKAM
jgi:hypothetical protein